MKLQWANFRTACRHNATVDANEFKASIFRHIEEVKRERQVAMEMHQYAATKSYISFGYDDKCGSQFCYQPTLGSRESATSASRFQYRWAIQGNHFPGDLLRFSLVPPCLKTGTNFGCTAFLGSLHRLEQLGKLGREVVRMTDSGPDNDAKETHALHWQLVHEGVLQKVTWISLPPKHSHNISDRYNSMLKNVIWPTRGSGGGCMAPMDMESIVRTAMKSQPGLPELAFHWTNFDFKAKFDGVMPPHL